MGISPMYVGALLPAINLTIFDDSGNAVNLTNYTLSSTLRNIATSQDTAMTGSWAITGASAGQAQYLWASGDTANAGDYNLIIKATNASNKPLICDPIFLRILAV